MEVRLVSMVNSEELSGMKLSILKDLEKTLKIGYEHQYRNILSKIVSNKKRFVKKRLPNEITEDICKYNTLASGLTNYLTNLFNVFGENAVLNAKKIFEESGNKWGKKLRRKINGHADIAEMYSLIMSLYINVSEMDYIVMSNDGLLWHFAKQGHGNLNGAYGKFHPRFYDIKAAWLHSFINSFTSQYTSMLEKKSEDEVEILTSIELREDTQ